MCVSPTRRADRRGTVDRLAALTSRFGRCLVRRASGGGAGGIVQRAHHPGLEVASGALSRPPPAVRPSPGDREAQDLVRRRLLAGAHTPTQLVARPLAGGRPVQPAVLLLVGEGADRRVMLE